MKPVSSAFFPIQANAVLVMKNNFKEWKLKRKERKEEKKRNKKIDEELRITSTYSKANWKKLQEEQKLMSLQADYGAKLEEAFKSMVGFGEDVTALTKGQTTQMKGNITGAKKRWMEEQRGKLEEGSRTSRANKQMRKLMSSMADGIKDTAKGIWEMRKGMGKKGLAAFGIIAAVLIAPIVALVAFFKQLAIETAVLKKLIGRGLKKLFLPFKALDKLMGGPLAKLFGGLGRTIKSISAALKSSKGFGAIGKIGTTIKSVLTSLGKFFAPVMKFFKTIMGLGSKLIPMGKVAQGILHFARGFGTILGKIFYPITLLMAAFDFITGFMSGYKEGGIMGGLEGGLSKMFKGLIGMPLDLLKSAISWILGKFGFTEAEKWLDAFSFSALIGDIIGGMFDMIDKAVEWVKLLFSDPVAALTKLAKGFFGGYLNIVSWLVDMIKKPVVWLLGLFGWDATAAAVETFSLKGFVMETWTKVKKWFGGLLSWSSKKDEGDSWIVTTIKTAVEGVKLWLGNMFKFDSTAGLLKGAFDIITFLPNMLWKGLTTISKWLLGLFGFNEAAQKLANVGKFSLGDIVWGGIEGIWKWLVGLFDIDWKKLIKNLIPSWVPDKALKIFGLGGSEETRAKKDLDKAGFIDRDTFSKDDIEFDKVKAELQRQSKEGGNLNALVAALTTLTTDESIDAGDRKKLTKLLLEQNKNNGLTRQGSASRVQILNTRTSIDQSKNQVQKIGISAPTQRPAPLLSSAAN